MNPAHRVYRGIADNHAGDNARLFVMSAAAGPTERERAEVLYELKPQDPFWWGYGGSSPGRTAVAILDDVLPDAVPGSPPPDALTVLRETLAVPFIQDFVAYFHDKEFWLPARTIVRWINGVLHETPQS